MGGGRWGRGLQLMQACSSGTHVISRLFSLMTLKENVSFQTGDVPPLEAVPVRLT